ncbi:AraC family transcriptional regulator [Martelella lutilitoris]|uniref:AraC family transcriptional regulator n=1 Tax=Martelella lutilitoris TaxID=2583532 RepID=A0A5C4JM15_9HYPH|nr:AraC family transcriptional regulator [Martelella lutilitoris]TNB46340.1 AraC family transcriptional regulator [Martelella lutilitoris]
MRTFEAKTSIDLFDLLIDLARQHDLISKPETAGFRKASAVLKHGQSAGSHMGEEAVLELGMLLVDRWGGPEVGAVLALQTDLTRLGILGELILQSETPHAVFYQIARFNRLLNQRSAFELTSTPHQLTMTHTHARIEPQFVAAAQFGTIWALANVALIPEHVFGVTVSPVSAHFDFAAPSNLEPLHRVFGSRLLFEQPKAAVTFDRARLKDVRKDTSLPVWKALEDAAERGLDDVPALDGVAGRVRHHLGEHMAGSISSESSVASFLGMSVRTLQRRLSGEGTSFRQEVDAVRAETARRLLGDRRISLSEIAFRLGYGELSAFNHAALRWFGTSPGALRRKKNAVPESET